MGVDCFIFRKQRSPFIAGEIVAIATSLGIKLPVDAKNGCNRWHDWFRFGYQELRGLGLRFSNFI